MQIELSQGTHLTMAEMSKPTARPDPARVAVVAAGIVSPLGIGLGETQTSLREGRDCISPVTMFSVDQCRCKIAGQVLDSRLAVPGNDRSTKRQHRVAKMMIMAL